MFSCRLPSRLPLLGWVLAGAACGGGDLALPSDTDPPHLELIRGDEQTGPPGARLPDSLVVRLLDADALGITGRMVNWLVSAGGGSVSPQTSTTDSAGYASARWTLGPAAGPNSVDAVVSRVGLVTFTALGTGGAAEARIEPVEGDDQIAPVGEPVPVRPTVRVITEDDDPVAGLEVRFVITGGGGRVTDAVQTTNADGIARVGNWVLGPNPGTNTLEARAGSLDGSPVLFTAEATSAGGVDHLVFLVQPADVAVEERFSVEVALVDVSGNVVPLSGILIYLGLFEDGSESPSNTRLLGNRFRETASGVAVFDDLAITEEGRYRLRALTDDLPELGPHGPEPFLFSDLFVVD
jgi:hypothetical protein